MPYEPQLIDATFALLVASSGDPLVIPALNRDGDILSDLVLPLFGSIAGSESLIVGFGDDYVPTVVLAEAAHGTAPSLKGKNVANPMAMILAGAAVLAYAGEDAQRAAQAIREACLGAVGDGVRTADLGGEAGTREFTDEVIRRTRSKLGGESVREHDSAREQHRRDHHEPPHRRVGFRPPPPERRSSTPATGEPAEQARSPRRG